MRFWISFCCGVLSASVSAGTEETDNNLRSRGRPDRLLTEDGGTTVTRGMVDLVHLVPFDVQIAVTENKGIQQHEVSNIVTAWMNDSFRAQLQEMDFTEENSYAAFDSVVLFNNDPIGQRLLQQGELYTAKFRGGAVFSRDTITRTLSVPKNDVLLIQQLVLMDDTSLANRLRGSNLDTLGSVVADVNAFVNPVSNGSGSTKSGINLESIIIGAIVVACIAFLFLLTAVFWAYRYDRNKQEAYKSDQVDRTDTSTARDETPEKALGHYPPVEIADSNYPESVISDSVVSGSVVSEDISASLSHYYKSGMGGKTSAANYRGGAMLSDAGSVSSIESYGYSVDAGLSVPLPNEVSTKEPTDQQERIGGLPIGPATPNHGLDDDDDDSTVEDVQIPDLDKELKILDIQLSPSTDDTSSEVVSISNSSTPSQPYVGQDYFDQTMSHDTSTLGKDDEDAMQVEDTFDSYWNLTDDTVALDPPEDTSSSNHPRRQPESN